MKQKEVTVILIIVAIGAFVYFYGADATRPVLTGELAAPLPPQETCECSAGGSPIYAGNGRCLVCVKGGCVSPLWTPNQGLYPYNGLYRAVPCASWDAHQARIKEQAERNWFD